VSFKERRRKNLLIERFSRFQGNLQHFYGIYRDAVHRKSTSTQKQEENNPFGANPFSAQELFTPQPAANKKDETPAANPFANLSFAKPSAAFSSLPASTSFGTVPLPKKEEKQQPSDGNETEYMKKMKKLNESFSQWADRQIKENPIAVWKDGVKVQILASHIFVTVLKTNFLLFFLS
jgi:hypothetical protein